MEFKSAVTNIRRTSATLRELMPGAEADIQATACRLADAATSAGFWISADGRIGEADVAKLLGLTAGSLANKRREGTAPRAYELGGGRHRVTYRITDVARWIEAHRDR